MFATRAVRTLGLSRTLARAPGRLGIALANIEATRRPAVPRSPTAAQPSRSTTTAAPSALNPRNSVAVLDGCVMEGLLAPVNRATERVLAHNGYELRGAPGQRCCGALHSHAGQHARAQALARHNIAAFERSGAAVVAVNSAGCGAAMKEYGHLLADDPAWRSRAVAFSARVRDVSELLADAGPVRATTARPTSAAVAVAVDHPCHLLHGQRLSGPPSRVLGAMDGVRAIELPSASDCCGSAGLYSLAQPNLSQHVLAPKLAEIAHCGASVVVTGNPGCMMHIGAGLLRAGIAAQTRHPLELLDAAYRAAAVARE